MQLSDFHFDLPTELIAQYPAPTRSASRLLCLDKTSGDVSHQQFTDLVDLCESGDLLIFNDTKVIPARLYGHKSSGGKVEILIERVLTKQQALAQIKVSKSPKPGTYIQLDDDIKIEVIGRQHDLFIIHFHDHRDVYAILDDIGEVPLPPYMERKPEAEDVTRYQTIYAKHQGAIAAPTAGLHFDETLIKQLQAKGVLMAYITLHVGVGTFQPVRVKNVYEHKMHSERITVSSQTCAQIKEVKSKAKKIIAVGTTTVRALETAAQTGEIKPFTGETDIFIYPGYKFNCIDAMITNFHLPESTLIMLISAFAGRQNILAAYDEAIKQRYRFYSYGDAMYIK